MSVNKNDPSIAEGAPVEPNGERNPATPPVEALSDEDVFLVVLDDLAPTMPPRSLSLDDQNLLRALQSILEKRKTDAWIDEMRAQITAELEWNDP
jgi:hypothetical protein